MAPPGYTPQVPPEHGEQPKDFDREERQAEHVRRARQPRREHGAGHEGGVCAQAGGESGADAAAVVEEEDVDAHEPEGDGPDGVGGGGLGEGLEDRGEAEEGAVDEEGGLGGGEALLVARGEAGGGLAVRGVVAVARLSLGLRGAGLCKRVRGGGGDGGGRNRDGFGGWGIVRGLRDGAEFSRGGAGTGAGAAGVRRTALSRGVRRAVAVMH